MAWDGREGCAWAYQTMRPIDRTSLMYHLAFSRVRCCLKRIPAAPVLVVMRVLFSFLNWGWLEKEGGKVGKFRNVAGHAHTTHALVQALRARG